MHKCNGIQIRCLKAYRKITLTYDRTRYSYTAYSNTHTFAKPSVKQLRRYSSCPRTYSHEPAVPVSNELLANENLMTDPAAATRTQCAICRVKSNILSGSASIFRGHDDNMLRIKPVPLLLAPLLLLQVNENPISRVYLHGFCIETNRREEDTAICFPSTLWMKSIRQIFISGLRPPDRVAIDQ